MTKRLFLLLTLVIVVCGCNLPGQKKEPKVSLYHTKTGTKEELPLEEYIAGVVAGEMLPNWPKQAYAAQAILARTFTLEFIGRGGTKAKYDTDLSDDITETQAYNKDAVTEEIRNAVKETRGLAAKYNNKYIKAWFHAFSGGETTTAKTGLSYSEAEPDYIKVVKDPGQNYAPPEDRSWTASYTFAEISKLLSEKGLTNFTAEKVEATQKNSQGRVTEFTVTGEGQSKKIPGPEFRIALDSTKLKSIWIENIDQTATEVTFRGKGYGHGVGMSQWGAYALAEQGKTAKEIVKYFFPDVTLTKVYQ